MADQRSHRRFCRALHEETGGDVLRYATITRLAQRLAIDEREAIVLAGDCAEAGYVRLDVKGPPYRVLPGSAILTGEGRQALKREVGLALPRDAAGYRSLAAISAPIRS